MLGPHIGQRNARIASLLGCSSEAAARMRCSVSKRAIGAGGYTPPMGPRFYPVILSGGSGTRLWPMSRKLLPKQFLALLSEHTLFQETALRVKLLEGAQPPIVVCNDEQRFLAADQLREIGVMPAAMILEPIGRNTAP